MTALALVEKPAGEMLDVLICLHVTMRWMTYWVADSDSVKRHGFVQKWVSVALAEVMVGSPLRDRGQARTAEVMMEQCYWPDDRHRL